MNKDKYTWSLSDMYKSDNDPKMDKDYKIVVKKNYEFINKWKNRKDYLKDPKILKEALDEYNELAEKYDGQVGYYLGLRNSQDETNKKIIKKLKQLEEIDIKISNDIEFFQLNICKIQKDKQSLFLNSKELLPYKHFLEKEFQYSEFLLSEKEEKLLTLTASTSCLNWIDMTEQFLSKEMINIVTEEGEKKEIPFAARIKYLQSKQKKVRDIAAKETLRVLTKWSDVAEHEMNSILENKKVVDNLRGHTRPDEARIFGMDVSSKIVDEMLLCVERDFSFPEKYYKLKAELLGKKKLTYFERYIPYGEISKEYSFEKAVEIVKKLLSTLDPEFKEIFEDLYRNGRYDVFPSRGKSGGAFCTNNKRRSPIYILLNFNNDLDSVLTLAHETGHAINNHLIFKNQLALNCDSPLSIAEVSSTFFEDFVLKELQKGTDKETRLSLLMQKLDSDIGTIHRQVACYRFEQELHNEFRKESYLSKERISEIFKKHMESYMGKYVTQDKGSEYFWVVWPHIRNYFYVYSYASGLLISKALQNMVKEDPNNIEKVKVMLSTGTSRSPEEMFKSIGIDITKKEFWEKGLQEIEDTYNETYKLAKELGKI